MLILCSLPDGRVHIVFTSRRACSYCLETDICDFLTPLELDKKDLILLVVNNQEDGVSVGGTHW